MNYGTKISLKDGKQSGYFVFATGRKIRLSPEENVEFANRLKMERATGRLQEQESQKKQNGE
jgi:hypothetical protein